MRILQVVTLLTPDGKFGGPARVALNQAEELARRGHTVTLAAATHGYADPPTAVGGARLQLFGARTAVPGVGFCGLTAPRMARWIGAKRDEFDIVHVHFGRDLVAMPAAAAARRHSLRYVLQPHGMVIPSRQSLARPLDTVLTRPLLIHAGAVLHLTALEGRQLEQVARTRLPLVPLRNGVPDYPAAVVRTSPPEVLFVSRIHSRKRPLTFVEMAKQLLDEGFDASFTLVGPDEGEGAALRAAVSVDQRVSWEGALPPQDIPARLAAASVFVLPSVREPYPMSVLEAMSVGLPVVVAADCGLAEMIDRTGCGIVVDGAADAGAYAAAVASILSDAGVAAEMARRARTTAQAEFGMPAIGAELESVYAAVGASS